MNTLNKNISLLVIPFYFLLFMLFPIQLFAESLSNTSTQLQLNENEKSWLSNHHRIKVGIDPDYPPYEWVDEDGKHVGMVLDYMHRLEKILGLRFEIVKERSWTQLLKMAKNGELDMLTSIAKTPERSKYLNFSESYFDAPTMIIDNGNGTFIGSLKELSNKRISVEEGYFIEEFMKKNYPKITLVTVPTTKEALQMVVDGLVDAYVGDPNVAYYAIKTNDLDTLRFSGQIEYISHHGFGLTRGNELLTLILNKAMATIPQDETEAIFDHWLDVKQGIKSETLIKYSPMIASIFLVIGYWVYVSRREVTFRKKAEKKLLFSETLYQELVEDMTDIIWKIDKDWYIIYLNPSFERLIGFRPDELIGHHAFELFTDEGIATVKEKTRQREEDEREGVYKHYPNFEMQYRCKDGSLIWVEISSKAEYDKDLKIIGAHGISRDVTQRKEMDEKIRKLAFHDALTKLPNRRLLYDRLNQTILRSKRNKKYAAIIYLDLDDFKPLNDKYGHDVGDLLLIEAAQRLKNSVREMDTAARIGGDEFIVILNDLSKEKETSTIETNIIAEKILSTLSATYSFPINSDKRSTIEHHCTASIGVLVFKADDESDELLLKHADAAMYEAKKAGRNRICFYGVNN